MNISQFFQFIRYKNLLILVFVQLLFSFFFFKTDVNIVTLLLIIQSTVLLAAAGNIINDFFDIETDLINKPNKVIVGKLISKKTTLLLYFVFNLFGILSGIVLAVMMDKIYAVFFFISISFLLYLYSSKLKKIPLLGNLVVSLLIAFSILMLSIFPPTTAALPINYHIYLIIYAVFAFTLNLIREIVKDIEDIDGDYKQHLKTLPIVLGRKRTQHIVYYLCLLPFIAIVILSSATKQISIQIYSIVALILPLAYFMYHIKEVKSKEKLHQLSGLLKIIMLLGILSILLLKTN